MTRSAFAFAALIVCAPCFAQTYKVQLFTTTAGQAYVTGVNTSGEVVGYVYEQQETQLSSFGFIYNHGVLTQVKSPLAGENNAVTQLFGVNSSGEIVGDFAGFSASDDNHGCFLLSPLLTYTYFGEGTSLDFPYLLALGINSIGEIVGSSFGADGIKRGFELTAGKYTYFSAPGAQVTSASGINNGGMIVGSTSTTSLSSTQGFLYNGTSFTIVSYPNSTSTFLTGINDAGTAAGYYYPSSGNATGFTYTDGTFTSVSLPQFRSVQILGINDLGAIYGTFVNHSAFGGFVAIPTQPGEEPTTEQIELKFN